MTAIGIMGGTFDPIHLGHLRAAEEVLEGFGLDRVVFVTSGTPPHKEARTVSASEHRHNMTGLAIKDNPRFEASRLEIDRQGPSYTLDTLRFFRETCGKDSSLYFITGLDAILGIPSWKSYRELLSLADFVAVTRPGYDVSSLEGLREVLGDPLFAKIHTFHATLMAISSSDVRSKMKEGRSVRYLVPNDVVAYAERERLYVD